MAVVDSERPASALCPAPNSVIAKIGRSGGVEGRLDFAIGSEDRSDIGGERIAGDVDHALRGRVHRRCGKANRRHDLVGQAAGRPDRTAAARSAVARSAVAAVAALPAEPSPPEAPAVAPETPLVPLVPLIEMVLIAGTPCSADARCVQRGTIRSDPIVKPCGHMLRPCSEACGSVHWPFGSLAARAALGRIRTSKRTSLPAQTQTIWTVP